jgi:hypothetical protein
MDVPLLLTEVHVLGPLPRLHLVTLAVVSVVLFLGAGLWLGHLTAVPLPLPLGAVLGALAGALVAWAMVHDFHQRNTRQARAVRRD